MNKLIEYLKKLIFTKFYGKIEITLEAGQIVNIRETKSLNVGQFKEVIK